MYTENPSIMAGFSVYNKGCFSGSLKRFFTVGSFFIARIALHSNCPTHKADESLLMLRSELGSHSGKLQIKTSKFRSRKRYRI